MQAAEQNALRQTTSDLSKAQAEAGRKDADNQILVAKLEEAVRVATNAQRQCLSLEQSTAVLEKKNQQMITTEALKRDQIEVELIQTREERERAKKETDILKRTLAEESRRTAEEERKKRVHFEKQLVHVHQESERAQHSLKINLVEIKKKQEESKRQVAQYEYELEHLRTSLSRSKMEATAKEKAAMTELEEMKLALREQRSQLESLSQSHLTLESDRRQVSIELSDLKISQQRVQIEMEQEKEKAMRESALVMESVKRGADDFSSALRESGASYGRSRFGTH